MYVNGSLNENEQYQLEDQAPAEDQGEQSSEESDIGIANEKDNGELQEDYDIINIQKTQNQLLNLQFLNHSFLSYDIFTSILPVFFPENKFIKAVGALSMPSTTVSFQDSLPESIQPFISFKNCS